MQILVYSMSVSKYYIFLEVLHTSTAVSLTLIEIEDANTTL